MELKTQGEMWYVKPNDKRAGYVHHARLDVGWAKAGPAAVYLPSTALNTDAMFVVSPSQFPGDGPEFQYQADLYETDPIAVNAEGEILEQKVKVKNKREEKFPSAAYMRVDFEEISDLDDVPAGKIPFVVTYDEEAEVWVKVPVVDVDYRRNDVFVETLQFSTWGAGMGDSLPQNGANVLVFDEPYVSLFTGRSRFSYPIWTPPARAGMGPSISLSYTSGTVDGVLGDIQAPWIGVGWSIDGIEIVRKITTDENGYGYENEFALTINGTKYELVEDDEIDGRYHTEDASFLYVQRHNPALGNDGGVSNGTSEWWEVAATDGTRYRLGWNGDSGGSRHEADIPWSGAQLTFNGNGIDFVYREKPSYGIVEIYIDGDKYASVDQYNDTEQAGQSIHVTLADGEHVLEIRRADRKNADSSGYVINLDKVVVYSAATPTATHTPTITHTPTGTPTPTPTPTYKQITVGETVSTHVECSYSIDFSHTVDEGDDRLLVVTFVHRRENSQNVWGVKYNDVSLTKVAERGDPGGDEAIVHMWYMVNPPEGTHDVFIGINGSACTVAGAYNLYGVDVTDPVVDYDTTITWTGPVSLNLDSSSGDMGVDVVGINGNSGLIPGAGQTERWEEVKTGSGWAMRGGGSTEPVTGSSVTMSYSFVHEREGAYVAAVIRSRQDPWPTTTATNTPSPTPTATEQTGWEYAYYTYDSQHPHAVATIARSGGNDTFDYDNIGNMTDRLEGGTDWDQAFNAEGRLSSITDGTDTWTFTYDGDGNRIKQDNPDGTTTLFLGGGAYEAHIDGQTTTVTKYYAIAGQRVMRDSSGLHYLLTDHLGSVVAVLDDSGDLESDERYLPFGGLRDSTGISQTDFAFTGQRNLSSVGLMDYNARWYLPSIGRFISADVIGYGDRYSYTHNNPLRFIDPSGHKPCNEEHPDDCMFGGNPLNKLSWDEKLLLTYGVKFDDDWPTEYISPVIRGVYETAKGLAEFMPGISPSEAFNQVYGTSVENPLFFEWNLQCDLCRDDKTRARCGSNNFEGDCAAVGAYTHSSHHITFASMWAAYEGRPDYELWRRNNVVHELGHAFNAAMNNVPYDTLSVDISINYLLGRGDDANLTYGFASAGGPWVQNRSNTYQEIFADMFPGFIYNTWETVNGTLTERALERQRWMEVHMNEWLCNR